MKTKKLLSVLLTLCMVMSLFSVCTLSASAEEIKVVKSGGFTYTYDGSSFTISGKGKRDGFTYNYYGSTLEISGKGKIPTKIDTGDADPTVLEPEEQGDTIYTHNGVKTIIFKSGITGIGSNNFTHYGDLEKIIFPKTVKTLDEYAFGDCPKLREVNFKEGLKTIKSCAFFGCELLKDFTLPKSLETLWGDSFCSGYTVKDGVKLIGNWAIGTTDFEGGTLTFPEGVKHIASWFLDAGTAEKTKTVKFPKSLKSISIQAFIISAIEKVEFGNKIESIGDFAFSNCNLKSITIPKSVKKIGKGILEYNLNLEKIKVAKGSKYFYVKGNCLINKKTGGLIMGCNSSVIPKKGVKYIGNSAFLGMTLKKITIPKTVTSIKDDAFMGVKELKTVKIPEKCKKIGDFAFCYVPLKSVKLPDGLKSVGKHAFSSTLIKEIKIPGKVKKISASMFDECKKLKKVTLPKGLTSIGSGAFYKCTSLKNITIPDGVKAIKDYTFYGCKKLESVKLSKSLETIGNEAFYRCKNLKKITFPKNLKTIGSSAFHKCTGLKTVKFNDKIKTIYPSIFSMCTSLKTVYLGKGVKKIHINAFCDSPLKTVYFTSKEQKKLLEDKFKYHEGVEFKIAK